VYSHGVKARGGFQTGSTAQGKGIALGRGVTAQDLIGELLAATGFIIFGFAGVVVKRTADSP
jgi:hypothetical protein